MTLPRSRLRFSSLALAAALTAFTANAFAERSAAAPAAAGPVGPAPSTLATTLTGAAKADYDSGKLLYGDGDYGTAAVKFRRAYDASSDPRLLWNVAACEKALRHYTKALELVERYETLGQPLLTAADRKEAEDLASALRATTDTLTLAVNLGGADVSLDDEKVATTPLDHVLRVDLGDHKIGVQKSGYAPYAKTVSFTGAGVTLQVALEIALHRGQLRVDAGADDAVVIDGRLQASGGNRLMLASGSHTVQVSARGKTTYQSDVVVEDDQTTVVHVHLTDERSSGASPWPWVIAGGAAAAIAGGIVAGYYAAHKSTTDAAPVPGTLGILPLSSFRLH